jgi:hypothetical protein
MGWVAKTARPAVGVWRTSNIGDTGAPVGKAFGDSEAGTEEIDDGREILDAVLIEAGAKESSAAVSIVVCEFLDNQEPIVYRL